MLCSTVCLFALKFLLSQVFLLNAEWCTRGIEWFMRDAFCIMFVVWHRMVPHGIASCRICCLARSLRIASHCVSSLAQSHRIASLPSSSHIASYHSTSRPSSNHAASHRIASHRIASHRIASHRIRPHIGTSRCISSDGIRPHRIAGGFGCFSLIVSA